jgi:hypothetical protein
MFSTQPLLDLAWASHSLVDLSYILLQLSWSDQLGLPCRESQHTQHASGEEFTVGQKIGEKHRTVQKDGIKKMALAFKLCALEWKTGIINTRQFKNGKKIKKG